MPQNVEIRVVVARIVERVPPECARPDALRLREVARLEQSVDVVVLGRTLDRIAEGRLVRAVVVESIGVEVAASVPDQTAVVVKHRLER